MLESTYLPNFMWHEKVNTHVFINGIIKNDDYNDASNII